ncbi:hypothetical protein AAFF_G00124680 [Aldrovandia affinis]|uniref:Uncharacterized protein n=1 Tax=Aldrovandia affinis TaxID=143900 RepID=A0AAD7RRI4_9TELE|nr:hypothetical protein AAFF_G00124680 [Aldrovandia affinis]
MDSTVAYMMMNKIPKLVQNSAQLHLGLPRHDELELLEQMPLVMRMAITVDINLTTYQKINLFKETDEGQGPSCSSGGY